ncbi:hypothetical protein PPTG_10659 [Phytophthora nicotianae INRA-310]|uniref:TRP C-terminal domain-containing protein n=1 Tax=Phytophthora nicotianae (strain INRA-310) TaxID=761204 RepID=W2QBH6_PHYN3|nr:hypothetical protein PPTG_10659 [Phytophthora nicotianae INRA-310]ETN10538.1 hypothetical protein PPTG_10659 [Phytophthora nicotianae INRA-310]
MRSWFFLTTLVAVASTSWLSQVEAAACAEICYTTALTGFGPGGSAGCSCSGSQQGARTGSGSCSCGQCYEQSGSTVIGYAINSDGTCTYGTDCGDCDYSSTSSGSTTTTTSPTTSSGSSTTSTSSNSTESSTPTPTTGRQLWFDWFWEVFFSVLTVLLDVLNWPRFVSYGNVLLFWLGCVLLTFLAAPSTPSPVVTSGTSSNSTSGISSSTADNSNSSTTPTSSNSGSNNNNAGEAGSAAGDSSSNGLKTWQIALIICCGVLVFTVAVVSVLSCYCKARNRLYENEDDQADASYYQQQYPRQREDAFGSTAAATPTLFPQGPTTSSRRSGSSGSFTNELKTLYANSANSGSTDRLGVGLAPVHIRNSSGDLAGMAGSYPNERILSGSYSNERILSGSYPTDRRASASNRSQGRRPSLEQGYSTARDRDSLAVEL